MHGIVSLLDDQHTELVEKLWTEMAQQFGVGNPAATPALSKAEVAVPHFSYHVAKDYDLDRLARILERLAEETAVFPIQTAGIAVFPGAESVIYVPVARNLALTWLHERVWTAVNPTSQGSVTYYAPDGWFPHITLAHGDVTAENLGPIVTWLHSQTIAWTISIDNFALVRDNNGRHETCLRSAFQQP